MELENVKLKLYGKECEFKVSFYDDEHIKPVQWEALKRFLCCSEDLLAAVEEPLRQFCLEVNQNWFYNYGDDETGNAQDMIPEDYEGKLTDVFRVLTPIELYIEDSEKCCRWDNRRIAALVFEHRFRADDELMVVFRDEQFYSICWDWEFA